MISGLERRRFAEARQHHHRDIELAVDEKMLEIFAAVLEGGDSDAGKGAAETGEQVGEDIAGDQRRGAEVKFAGRRASSARVRRASATASRMRPA